MKTAKLLPKPLFLPQEGRSFPAHSLKAYFYGCVLTSSIASKGEACPTYNDQDLVERAYRVGEPMFEKYVEGSLSAVSEFNKKVGL